MEKKLKFFLVWICPSWFCWFHGLFLEEMKRTESKKRIPKLNYTANLIKFTIER